MTVLYLAANPDKRRPLRVEAEVRRVQEAVRGSKFRDNIIIQYRPAADLESLIDGLNDHRPGILHFSGHGNDLGIASDNGSVRKPKVEFIGFNLLAKAVSATDTPPDVIVLNSCKSSAAKKELLPCAKIIIAMRAAVTDIAASAFAARFYAALASGQSVKSAFEQGKVAVEKSCITEGQIPELLSRDGTNPSKMILT